MYPDYMKESIKKVEKSRSQQPDIMLDHLCRTADCAHVGGCHPGECHYQVGNLQTRKRIMLLHRVLEDVGIGRERLRLEWISASEGPKFKKTINEFTDTIRQLGPLGR